MYIFFTKGNEPRNKLDLTSIFPHRSNYKYKTLRLCMVIDIKHSDENRNSK